MGRNHVPQRASIQLCSKPYWPLSGKFLLGITKFDLHFHHPFPRNSNWWRYTSETCQILLLTHRPASLYPNLYWCSVSVLRVATVHSGGSHSESGPTGILSRDGAQRGTHRQWAQPAGNFGQWALFQLLGLDPCNVDALSKPRLFSVYEPALHTLLSKQQGDFNFPCGSPSIRRHTAFSQIQKQSASLGQGRLEHINAFLLGPWHLSIA